jgi:hypothetical protein
MKKIIALSTVPAIFALLAITNLNLSSCTKSNPVTIRDTTFVTVHDTTIVKDTITKAPSILSMFTAEALRAILAILTTIMPHGRLMATFGRWKTALTILLPGVL